MSIGRNHPATGKNVRDERADYLEALIAEYDSYVNATGLADKAAEVAAILSGTYGHEVRPQKPEAGQKERAVSPEPLERAVEGNASPKRGRPKKATAPAATTAKA